jgi:hypothetical protein
MTRAQCLAGALLTLASTAALCPAATSAHVSAWKPVSFHLEWREQVTDTAPKCDSSSGSLAPVSADETIIGTAWTLRAPFAQILYDGLRGGPAMVPGLDGGGVVRLTRRVSWVAMSCSDGSQSTGTCDDTGYIGEFPPIRWASSRRTHRTRFRFEFLPWTGLYLSTVQQNRLECRNAVEVDPPDELTPAGPTPQVLVPVRTFASRRPRIEARRTYTVSDGSIRGTRTFSLRMTLRKYVEPRAPCRGSGPNPGFVCSSRGPEHRGG